MSEPKFTRGNMLSRVHIRDDFGSPQECEANQQLIEAAFSAATAAHDDGYDGIEAVKQLPKIIEALRGLSHVAGCRCLGPEMCEACEAIALIRSLAAAKGAA